VEVFHRQVSGTTTSAESVTGRNSKFRDPKPVNPWHFRFYVANSMSCRLRRNAHLRLLLLPAIALTACARLQAGVIDGTSTTTPLFYDSSTVDSDLQSGIQFGVRFTAPMGNSYYLTGFSAPLVNSFRSSPISITFGVYTAIPRTPATTPATQQPGILLDSVTFNVPNAAPIALYTPLFAGNAVLLGGINYFLIGRVNTTGGITQVDWAESAVNGTKGIPLGHWIVVKLHIYSNACISDSGRSRT